MAIFHKLIWFFRVLMKLYNILWLKFLNGSVKKHPFYPCQNELCFYQAILVHVALNANELCWTPPLSSVGDEQYGLL